MALDRSFHGFRIGLDSQEAVLLQESGFTWTNVENNVKDIEGLMSHIAVVDVCFQPRQWNKGLKEGAGSRWDVTAPFWLCPTLEHDRNFKEDTLLHY